MKMMELTKQKCTEEMIGNISIHCICLITGFGYSLIIKDQTKETLTTFIFVTGSPMISTLYKKNRDPTIAKTPDITNPGALSPEAAPVPEAVETAVEWVVVEVVEALVTVVMVEPAELVVVMVDSEAADSVAEAIALEMLPETEESSLETEAIPEEAAAEAEEPALEAAAEAEEPALAATLEADSMTEEAAAAAEEEAAAAAELAEPETLAATELAEAVIPEIAEPAEEVALAIAVPPEAVAEPIAPPVVEGEEEVLLDGGASPQNCTQGFWAYCTLQGAAIQLEMIVSMIAIDNIVYKMRAFIRSNGTRPRLRAFDQAIKVVDVITSVAACLGESARENPSSDEDD